VPPPIDETPTRDPPDRLLPKLDIPADDPDASALAGGAIEVRGFRFSGNTVFSDDQLAAISQDHAGEGR